MSPADTFLLVGAMALATFATRYGLLALSRDRAFPASLRRALSYVPPAVLTAIIVPAALMPDGRLDLGWHNAHLVGAVATAAIGLVTRNLLATIVGGMVVFGLWRWWI